MKKPIIALLATLAISTSAYAETCKVTDPTGTPLNARATPNGKIIGKVRNGTMVYIDDYDYDRKGRPWALVFNARNGNYIGWVFREFISCY
ncbi:SH3 domain-containing protein [Moraxella sp.]|uniref:SH3 domain-containing protein n=1 Tax=Moraxella sp. TaxID=479 RepID=UPI0026DBBAC6|nr:SH3 domain-containing protein [Moraxella sp.]MDO4895525.1 SH3 domain-containing protein [Moraxella sp.]